MNRLGEGGVRKGAWFEGNGMPGLGAQRRHMDPIQRGESVDVLKMNFSVGVNMYRLNVTSY